MPKNAKKYECDTCDFKCSKESNWNIHLMTRKHQNRTLLNNLEQKNAKKCEPVFICKCGKQYVARNSLWYHKKVCKIINKDKSINNTTTSGDIDKELLVKMLLKNQDVMEGILLKNQDVMENKDLLIKMLLKNQDVMEKMVEIMPQLGNNNINSNNNTTNFNIQMFLNNHCKDAMNLTDFIQSLPITNKTYDDTIENGLTKTITNMMVNGLNDLDILKRPIHCTDTKRKTLYVKESDIWERDNELIKILNGITEIAFKQRTMIKKWQEANDGWETIEKIQLKLTRLISNSMTSIEEDDKETNKIIRSISNKVYLDNGTKKIKM